MLNIRIKRKCSLLSIEVKLAVKKVIALFAPQFSHMFLNSFDHKICFECFDHLFLFLKELLLNFL
jgi:hypothetical protein